VNLRRAATVWLALALLAGALLPATAVVLPRFGGPKSGAAAPEGVQTPHGATGATGAAGRGGRVPHPELLRAAAEADAEILHGRTQKEAEAAAREQAAQSQPWAAAPHMRVRLTGDPVLDAALLNSLNAELATPINPDRVRAVSLADDALADDTLASLQPRRPDAAQQQLWRFLRGHPPQLDRYHLTQALRPLQGDTLLVMAHVDGADGALVFKARNGRPVRLPVTEFEQAAGEAGVHLIIVGCKSARHTSAGFVDDLNAVDAARAMARAAHARPSTMFDLYNALSGPQRVMEFNASTFSVIHTVEVTAGPDGAVLSTLHWSGPQVAPVAARAASATETPAPAPASVAAVAADWFGAPTLKWLTGALLLSWLAGFALRWLEGGRGGALAHAAGIDAFGHLLLTPLALTVLAEAVAGEDAAWWAWGAGLLTGGAALVLALTCTDSKSRRVRPQYLLMALRMALLALPLLAVALLHTRWLEWPAQVIQVLHALYGLGRPLPGPWLLIGGGFALAWVVGMTMDGFEGVRSRRAKGRERAGRLALWREQLAADGVSGAAVHAALSARQAFDRRCATPVAWVVRWDQAKALTDGHAPDPWSGLPHCHWRLVAVPLVSPMEGVNSQAAFGLLRVGSPFMHPLPPTLLQRWRDKDLRAADLPVLLAQIEPRLRWTDFLLPDQLPGLRAVMLFGAAFSAAFAGIALIMDPGSGERGFCAGTSAVLLALLVLWPTSILARRRWHLRWLQRVRPKATPPCAQPPTAAAAG
jgi:hypothetical protein